MPALFGMLGFDEDEDDDDGDDFRQELITRL